MLLAALPKGADHYQANLTTQGATLFCELFLAAVKGQRTQAQQVCFNLQVQETQEETGT